MTVLDLGGVRASVPPVADGALLVVWSLPTSTPTPADLEAVLLEGFRAVVAELAGGPSRVVNLVVLPEGSPAPLHGVLAATIGGWGRGLARELARSGGTVNTVVGRGDARCDGQLAAFLAGPDAGFVTGQTIGLTLPRPPPARRARRAQPGQPTVLVSGGAGDLGRAICSRLAAEGWRVAVGHRPGTDPGPTSGGAVPLDLTDDASIDAAVAWVGGMGGPLDGLVLNAGWTDTGPFVDSTPDARSAIVRVNLTGPARLLTGLADAGALASGAVVVATGSEAGRIGEAGRAVYSGAKAGIAALMSETDGAALRALSTAPGPYDTALLRGTWPDPERAERGIERLRQLVPLRRLGRPEELAAVVAFALSPAGGALDGRTLSVGGGITMV